MEVKKEKKNQQFKKGRTILLFILPALLVYLLFIIYPIIATFNNSLFEWNGISEKAFIGLENFKKLLADTTFWISLKNNLYLVLISIFVQVPLGLIMALVIVSNIKGKKILNVLYFLPFLMSAVAIGLLWVFLYDPVNGPINKLLNVFGIESIHWLANSKSAIFSILVVIVWQFAPFYMILFRASMVGIPEELYEAAEIDGANSLLKFLTITLPLLLPTIITSSILAVVGSLKTFDIFYVMLGGGAGNSTEILGTYMYKHSFINFNMGYGSAIASVMFILSLISVILIFGIDVLRKRKAA